MSHQSRFLPITVIQWAAVIVCTLAPLLLLSFLVYRYGVNIPYYDEWTFIPLLVKQHEGTIQFLDLLAQHNEHRLFFPRLLFLFFAGVSHWNIRLEYAASIVIAIGTCIICTAAVYRLFRTIGEDTPPWSMPILSLIIFSLTQWQNWLWGWQVQIFLCLFFTLLGFFLLSQRKLHWYMIVAAFLSGIVAVGSFGTGLLFFPISFWLLSLHRKARQQYFPSILTVWGICSLLLLGGYFIGFHRPADSLPLLLPNRFFSFIIYIAAYLGAPASGFSVISAILVGIFGMSLFGYLFFRLRSDHYVLSFFLALGLFACCSAIITAIPRGEFGPLQAMSSRYTTIAAYIWIANIFLLLFALKREAAASVLSQTIAAITVVVLVVSIGGFSMLNISQFPQQYAFMKGAEEAVLTGLRPYRIQRLHRTDVALVERGIPILKRYHLSLFHP